MSRPCSVKNCEDRKSKRHQFPDFNKDPELFKKWVDLCQNLELQNLEPHFVRKNKKVCHKHFSGEHLMQNDRISKVAYPTLFLPQETEAYGAAVFNESVEETVLNEEAEFVLTGIITQSPSTSQGLKRKSDYNRKNTRTPINECMLLANAGVQYQNELTPKAKRLYLSAKRIRRQNAILKKRTRLLKTRLKDLSPESLLDNITANLPSHITGFIKSQINLWDKKGQGKRYNLQDKILGLVIYKQSPKSYRLLEKLFALPSSKTLRLLLKKIPIKTGINDFLFETLRKNLENRPQIEMACILIFDEMAIEAHVNFNGKEFVGFEDLGDDSSQEIADHAQVFMLRSVDGRWKQPVYYGFSKSATKSISLCRIIKALIQKCHSIGIRVVATVSDQGTNNCAAINHLMTTTVNANDNAHNIKFFYVEDKKIVHIYDPPHLLKGIRNNLITKNLIWEKKDEKLVASWDDVYTLYKMDNMPGEMRAIHKITEYHVNPEKIKKMKVSYAAQVFSHSVSSLMNLLIRLDATTPEGIKLPKSATGTAAVLKFFDDLFDSVNGTSYLSTKKPLKCCFTKSSGHSKFWSEARSQLSSMYYVKNGAKAYVPSLKNWVYTLNGIEETFKILSREFDLKELKTRSLNQDPIENFFGQMRQQGSRNINPTASLFQSHFKTLLINNLTKRHSASGNCEQDSSQIISSVENLLVQNVSEEMALEDLVLLEQNCSLLDKIKIMPVAYVSGYLSKYLKTLPKCNICKANIICGEPLKDWHDLILSKEFNNKCRKLTYCTPAFIGALCDTSQILKKNMPLICSKKNFFNVLNAALNDMIKITLKEECEHSAVVQLNFLKSYSLLYCRNWAASINRILNGRDQRIFNFEDKVMKAAQLYYKKRRKTCKEK